MLHRTIIILTSLLLFALNVYSLDFSYEEEINWQDVQTVNLSDEHSFSRCSFDGASYTDFEPIPYFSKNYLIHTSQANINVRIENAVYISADSLETLLLVDNFIPNREINIESSIVVSRKQPYVNVYLAPLRWNEEKNIVEKLQSFTIIIDLEERALFANNFIDYADNSVLDKGDWFKIKVNKGGVYKLTYSQLKEIGYNV